MTQSMVTGSESVRDYLEEKYGKATLTPNEFARESGRSGAGVRRMIARGEIRASRIGGRWVIPIGECVSILEGGKR